MSKGRKTEKLFIRVAKEAGLKVKNSNVIRIENPVEDKNGDNKKTVTLPDAKVIDPATKRVMLVEVTSGSGKSAHKRAQQRVADAAGVENYIQLSGADIREISEQPTPSGKKSVLFNLFGWILMGL